jgi:hypothetical protein
MIMREHKALGEGIDEHGAVPVPAATAESEARRMKFGAAAEGWEAYNTWLDRVRQQPPRPMSRQAVVAKALYSVSSYKNWADKARGAFDAKGK